ncbi:hypothetical protein NIES4071_90300 [Calothrix sp. NIES-4071]|nr:hypothetical protein NIES4071_90300 [Calothrix sp. NIES-4071]BAZ63297.1 hypothetical protein NIES4105_90230 [Calothrix sp. NIES-4105]
MKRYLQKIERFILAVSLLVATVSATSPGLAATVSFSRGEIQFDFSQSPIVTQTNANTSAVSIFGGGRVLTTSDAIAFVGTEAPQGSGYSQSLGQGGDGDHIGVAESQAFLRATFDVAENTPFFFDFAAILNLVTSIDTSNKEDAIAYGNVVFELLDINENRLLDFFVLESYLAANKDDDFIIFDASDNLIINDSAAEFNFGGNQEFARGFVSGGSGYSFTQPTTLVLSAYTKNRALVQVAEPSFVFALLLVFAISIAFKLKYKTHNIKETMNTDV